MNQVAFRRLGMTALCMLAIAGCGSTQESTGESTALATQEEQRDERRDLLREQEEERVALHEDQTEERSEEHADTQEEVAEVREDATEERQEVIADQIEACASVPEAEQAVCPVDRTAVARLANTDDGIQIRLKADAGSEAQVSQRIECYQARREAVANAARLNATAPVAEDPPVVAATSCIFDDPAVNVSVDEENGNVFVALTAEGSGVTTLRRSTRAQYSAR